MPVRSTEEARAGRVSTLERENEMLRAERIRLERLLALALEVAVGQTNVDPLALLDVLGELAEADVARPAYVEEQERRDADRRRDEFVRLLRETDPKRSTA
jgi:hypothetical protein